MAAKVFCTALLPPPRRSFRPEDAVHWLTRDFHRYYGLVPFACEARSASMQGAIQSLTLDIGILVQACGAALAKGRAVEVVLYDDPRLFHRHTRELELVLEAEELLRSRGVHTALRTRLQRALRERRRVAASLPKSRSGARKPGRRRRTGTRSRRRGPSPQER